MAIVKESCIVYLLEKIYILVVDIDIKKGIDILVGVRVL